MNKVTRLIVTAALALFIIINAVSMVAANASLLWIPLIGQAVFFLVKLAQHYSAEIQYRLGDDRFLALEQLAVAAITINAVQMAGQLLV